MADDRWQWVREERQRDMQRAAKLTPRQRQQRACTSALHHARLFSYRITDGMVVSADDWEEVADLWLHAADFYRLARIGVALIQKTVAPPGAGYEVGRSLFLLAVMKRPSRRTFGVLLSKSSDDLASAAAPGDSPDPRSEMREFLGYLERAIDPLGGPCDPRGITEGRSGQPPASTR